MSTQTDAIVAKLREMPMRGKFAAGERLGEDLLAQQLQVSRTPIRLALSELAKEGLLDHKPNCGFEVYLSSTEHTVDAVTVREQFEGMAAACAAQKGLSEEHLRTLEGCLLQVDGMLLKPQFEHRDVSVWAETNSLFHNTIVAASGNAVIADFIMRLEHIPLAASKTVARTHSALGVQQAAMRKAQLEHRWVFEAIADRDIGKAKTLMKRHVMEGRQHLRCVLERLQPEADHKAHPFLRLLA